MEDQEHLWHMASLLSLYTKHMLSAESRDPRTGPSPTSERKKSPYFRRIYHFEHHHMSQYEDHPMICNDWFHTLSMELLALVHHNPDWVAIMDRRHLSNASYKQNGCMQPYSFDHSNGPHD